jgi:Flp pilus assembly protein TadG
MKIASVRALFGPLKGYASDNRGASAVEFALWITFMVIPFLNVVDLGFYIFRTMQVREAAQAGAQSVANICGYNGLTPAATSCTAVNSSNTIITDAIQSTSLGTKVCLGSAGAGSGSCPTTITSAPYEGWYCSNVSGGLTANASTWLIYGGTASTNQSTCNTAGTGGAAVTGSTETPGDYAVVTVTYTYQPVLSAVSLISVLSSNAPITQTAWMRIN